MEIWWVKPRDKTKLCLLSSTGSFLTKLREYLHSYSFERCKDHYLLTFPIDNASDMIVGMDVISSNE